MSDRVFILSGGFDPVHPGHIAMFESCKRFPESLVVVGVNSDEWLTKKKGKPFQRFRDRLKIVQSMECVDIAMGFEDDDDGTAIRLIQKVIQMFPGKLYSEFVFANGGDRGAANTPEVGYCKAMGINLLYAAGGAKKYASSSELLADWFEHVYQEKSYV